MEGASAALAFVQLGLSIATTLNTYIADVRHGRGDIADLANEIEATVLHAQELDKLIKEDELTARWSEKGRDLANKCLTNCRNVIKKLSDLLRRSGGTASGKVLNGADEAESNDTKSLISWTDIDMSNFNRLYWPLLKPQLKCLKQELYDIKLSILLAVNTYQINATQKTEERKVIAKRIVALWKSRTIARRQLVVFQRHLETPYDDYYRPNHRKPRQRDEARAEERGIPEPDSEKAEPPRGRERSLSTSSLSDDSSSRGYPHRQRSSESVREQMPRRQRSVLQDVYLGRHTHRSPPERNGLPFAPDPEYVSEWKSKGRQILDYALGFVLASGEDATGTWQNLSHLWDSYKTNPAALKSVLNKVVTAVPSKPKNTLPLVLRDPESPNGTAFTWSLLISKRSVAHAVEPINYPLELLSKRLLREERKFNRSGSLNLQAYNTLSTLPMTYQNMITDWLRPKSSRSFHWELLILDPAYGATEENSSRRKRLAQRFRRTTAGSDALGEPTSVLAVFKRCMKPDAETSSLRSNYRPSSASSRRARRKRKMQQIATTLMGALAASTHIDKRRSSRENQDSRSPRACQRRRRGFFPRSLSRGGSTRNHWRHRQEPKTGQVYEMFETEEPPEADDSPNDDLAEKIVTEYTGRGARFNGTTDGSRPNRVRSETMSDTPTANGDPPF
ncbi:uncharacterized protein KD926_005183 [Aspergillus affinis]|uniref:uncharacterized protein n=1 Tax=Aspergillus affinis TaxID=1070780 RepID=UPI0022FE25CB|nr:uncharacterized protein KD926_005183 [Aspergillus affinis]KAI9034861.1 hypothetical protein KD926_005183 [Aspergillus affinis]